MHFPEISNERNYFFISGRLETNPNEYYQRVTPKPLFFSTSKDYAGPVLLKDRIWGKAYIYLFICFSTKAVHLELVTNFTTEGFLAIVHLKGSVLGEENLHMFSVTMELTLLVQIVS